MRETPMLPYALEESCVHARLVDRLPMYHGPGKPSTTDEHGRFILRLREWHCADCGGSISLRTHSLAAYTVDFGARPVSAMLCPKPTATTRRTGYA